MEVLSRRTGYLPPIGSHSSCLRYRGSARVFSSSCRPCYVVVRVVYSSTFVLKQPSGSETCRALEFWFCDVIFVLFRRDLLYQYNTIQS